MKFFLVFTLLLGSFSSASLFSVSESQRLAMAGKRSLIETSRAHFESQKRTGVGLFYGYHSAYSPVHKSGVAAWTNRDRMTHVKAKLKQSFKDSLGSDRAVDDYVLAMVGDQENPQRVGAIQMTSSAMWVFRHLEAAYMAAGKKARWQQLLETMRKEGGNVTILMRELQKDGWEAVYWNPDILTPDDATAKKDWHIASARNAIKDHSYYPLEITINHYLVNYRPTHGSQTKLDLSGLEKLKQIPFWVGLTNFGEHAFTGYNGVVVEAQNTFLPERKENLRQNHFAAWGTAEKYLSGIIMIPPGTWN